MSKAALLPIPTGAGPSATGSRRLIKSPRVRSARFIGHNSVLCPVTLRVVTRPAYRPSRSVGKKAGSRANSQRHPSRQRACHCAAFREIAGSKWRSFQVRFCAAVQSFALTSPLSIRGQRARPLLKTTSTRRPDLRAFQNGEGRQTGPNSRAQKKDHENQDT